MSSTEIETLKSCIVDYQRNSIENKVIEGTAATSLVLAGSTAAGFFAPVDDGPIFGNFSDEGKKAVGISYIALAAATGTIIGTTSLVKLIRYKYLPKLLQEVLHQNQPIDQYALSKQESMWASTVENQKDVSEKKLARSFARKFPADYRILLKQRRIRKRLGRKGLRLAKKKATAKALKALETDERGSITEEQLYSAILKNAVSLCDGSVRDSFHDVKKKYKKQLICDESNNCELQNVEVKRSNKLASHSDFIKYMQEKFSELL